MSYKVHQITEPMVLGEGPHWDDRSQALYFISIIEEPSIHKFVLATKEHTKTKPTSDDVSFIIPLEGKADQFVVGLERKFAVVQWDGQNDSKVKVLRELFEVDLQTRNRINDGKVDPRGRLYAGTMGHAAGPGPAFELEVGSLYRLDGAEKINTLATGISVSNGLAWDAAAKVMYYADSMERRIRRYQWDPNTGDVSNMNYIYDFEKSGIEGIPDGGTIDTDGNLWWAAFGGACVLQLDPNSGKVLRKVDIPAKQVTSCTFGGPNLDILFVTTASVKISEEGMKFDEEQKPPCGAVFMVTGLGAKGYPNLSFKL